MEIRDPRVPYDRLEAAAERARKRYPDAKRIKALWTPANGNDITVEVHDHDGRARVGAIA
jgi:hypothetical protein